MGPRSATVPVDRQVTITFDRKDIEVQPEVFLARLGGPGVEFVVKDLPEGYTLEIDFRSQGGWKCPFLFDKPVPGRPVRGRYVLDKRHPRVLSGRVDEDHFKNPSVWKYEVVLRRATKDGTVDVLAIDPMGVLK